MELAELALSNFKKFTDGRFRFCPGLNLLCGPNESGKSTIHEAICCALFGRERNKAVENWNGGSCSVELTYRSDGKTFRIERGLTEGSARAGVLVGDELTDVVSGKDEIARLLADHLGIASRAVFDNTVSIRQMHMSGPDASDMEAVGGEIQRVLTGTAHVSAAEVLERLEARRDDLKGRARPTNPREYDGITDRLRKLAEDLAGARNSREQISSLGEELADLETRIARDSKRLTTLEALLERHKRWSELKENEAEANSLHESVFATLRKLEDTIADLEFVQKELAGYANLVGKDDEIAEHLSKIAGRRSGLENRLAELEAAGKETQPAAGGVKAVPLLIAALVLAAAGLAAGFLVDSTAALTLLAPACVLAIIGLTVKYIQARVAARPSEFKRLAALTDSSRTELRQLDAEEKSILSYTKCRDVGRVSAKIKAYRNLAARANELETTLKALLNGRKLGEWKKQEADLARDLSNIRRELEDDFAGYSPSTEEVESWRSECARLQGSLPPAEARLHEVRGSLEAERRNACDLAALEGELEYLHTRKDELEFIHRAYEEAISALTSVTQMVSEEYLPAMSECASDHLKRLTSGRYTSVCVKPGWEFTVDCRDKNAVQLLELSIGTLDQLYFALRAACGELLSAGRKLPLILDDPFVTFDRERLDNALNLLEVMARENQILVMTHDPYVLDWARDLASAGGVSCVVHELPGPGRKQ